MRVLVLFCAVLTLSIPAHAYDISSHGIQLTVEPIVGYEWVPRSSPTPHSKGQLMYGARATGGMQYLALEVEYTHGVTQEDFPLDSLSTKDTDDKLKLGLRSSYSLGSLVEAHARAGGQAYKTRHEDTLNGVTTVTEPTVVYRPYFGLGSKIQLSSKTYATGDVVVVFNDINDMSRNEYQTSAGVAIHLP